MIHNNAMVPAPEPAARIWVRAFVENDVNVKLLNGKVALHVQHDWLDYRNDDDALDQALGDGKFDVSYGLILDGAGLLVVDIDAHDGRADGFETFERLRSRIPEIGDAGLIVETGGGGRHLYFRIPADLGLRTKLRDYPAIDFKTTGHVVGPGSTIGAGYRVVYGAVEDIDDAPEALIELLRRPVEVRRADIEVDGALSEQLETAHRALRFIDATTREKWLAVMITMKRAFGDAGFDLWDRWSAAMTSAGNYSGETQWRQWNATDVTGRDGDLSSLCAMAVAADEFPDRPAPAAGEVWADDGLEQVRDLAEQHRRASSRALAEKMWQSAGPVSGTPGAAWLLAMGSDWPAGLGENLRWSASEHCFVARITTGGIVRIPVDGGDVKTLGTDPLALKDGVVWFSAGNYVPGEPVSVAVDPRDALALIAMGVDGAVAALVRRNRTLLLGGAESMVAGATAAPLPGVTFYAAGDEDLRLGAAYSRGWQRNAGSAWSIVSPPDGHQAWVSAARGYAQAKGQDQAPAQAQVRGAV